ncbi:golgin subfamily A member 3-like isoform X1 [Notolabrus celidotus]|uniref:golgin subfamily A member 3-like isoform X1 n=1 Tax=Notolabrus celidotus TaxID=1203425 RepID=UPI00148F7CBA|nr:golgin subfamily A member 3-like isoform X1 [Notolabrus celidotus]
MHVKTHARNLNGNNRSFRGGAAQCNMMKANNQHWRPFRGPRGRAVQERTMEMDKLQEDVHQLNQMLCREKEQCFREKKERMLQVKDLDITKKQLDKERHLKETFMNRCKYLEGLLGDNTGENSLMHLGSTNKTKKTSNGFEAMQVDPLTSNKVSADLQAEVNKNKLLQEELDKVKAAHHEMGVRYENDMASAKQMVDTLQCELQKQKQVHTDKVSHDKDALAALTVEHKALGQKMAEVNQSYQNDMIRARQMVETFQCELQKQKQVHTDKVSHDKDALATLTVEHKALGQKMAEVNQSYQNDMASAKQMVETLQCELQKQKQVHTDKVSHDKDALAALTVEHRALGQKMAEVNQSYQNDMIRARQMVEALQLELQKQRQAQADIVSPDQSAIMTLKAEHHATCQKMAQEMADLQKSALQKEQMMVKELERVNAQLDAQKDYKELKELKTTGVGVFRAAILEERNKVSKLLEYLEEYKATHQELNNKYTSEVLSVRQQAENQKHQSEIEIKSYSDKLTQSQQHISHLRAEQDALRQHCQQMESFYLGKLNELGCQLSEAPT